MAGARDRGRPRRPAREDREKDDGVAMQLAQAASRMLCASLSTRIGVS
jgi:hypothetical protein